MEEKTIRFNKGFFYEPTVFDDVKDDFTIMKTEPFGPLIPIYNLKILMMLLKELTTMI